MHRAAIDRNLALKIVDQPGGDLHQGRLTCAVLAHQGMDLASTQREVHFGQDLSRAKLLGNPAHLQDDLTIGLRSV